MKLKALIILMLGIWVGMVIGISFLEAPLKFRAPNMTLSLGLGVGQIVFSALNKVEIVFSGILAFYLMLQYKGLGYWIIFSLSIIILLITIQSLWLLPVLNIRVDQILSGGIVEKTHHHFYFIAAEVLKVVLLIYGFFNIYKYG